VLLNPDQCVGIIYKLILKKFIFKQLTMRKLQLALLLARL